MTSRSEELFARALEVTPGGVNSPVRAFGAVGGTPRFMVRGSGPYLTDADGREYVDLVCSWGPMILGHAHPAVVSAVSAALEQMQAAGVAVGPVAVLGQERMLFFVVTRGSPTDEDEWWSCGLDSEPESVVAGLRWHCRDSYVPAPPSRDASGQAARWLRSPQEHPLPDALRLLEYLVDACEA